MTNSHVQTGWGRVSWWEYVAFGALIGLIIVVVHAAVVNRANPEDYAPPGWGHSSFGAFRIP